MSSSSICARAIPPRVTILPGSHRKASGSGVADLSRDVSANTHREAPAGLAASVGSTQNIHQTSSLLSRRCQVDLVEREFEEVARSALGRNGGHLAEGPQMRPRGILEVHGL